MDHFDPHINKSLQPLRELSLSAREKAQTRELLEEFMAFKPLQRAPQSYVRAISIFAIRPMIALALCAVLVVSTTTAAAAEQALPGDLLYPIKVHVTEEVRALATRNTETRAAWELERAERRVDEAILLEGEQRLTDEYRDSLEQSIDKHLARAEAVVAPQKDVIERSEETELSTQLLAAHTGTSLEAPPATTLLAEANTEHEHLVQRIALTREARDRFVKKRIALADTHVVRTFEPRAATTEIERSEKVSVPSTATLAMNSPEATARVYTKEDGRMQVNPVLTAAMPANEVSPELNSLPAAVDMKSPAPEQKDSEIKDGHPKMLPLRATNASLKENIERRFETIETAIVRSKPFLTDAQQTTYADTLGDLRTQYTTHATSTENQEASLRDVLERLYQLFDDVREAVAKNKEARERSEDDHRDEKPETSTIDIEVEGLLRVH